MLVAKREVYSYDQEIKIKSTKKVKQVKKNKTMIKLKIFGVAFLALLTCLGILFRYAQMTQIKMEVSNLDKEIEELNKYKTDISIQLEEIKESGWIEKEAEEKLGMVYPSSDQIIYISVKDNFSEDNYEDNVTKEVGIFKLFSNLVTKVSNKF